MPVFKDEQRNTYYVKCYYTDWTGSRKQKCKRGFKLQREAKEWERVFLEQQAGTPEMTFGALWGLYYEDCKKRNKLSTCKTKEAIYKQHLEPYWKGTCINQITPADVRQWQSKIIASGKSQAYLRAIHRLFSIVLNYAMRYYGLKSNPCLVAGSMGKADVARLNFWTLEQFQAFINTVDSLPAKVAFLVLFYSGIRCGELLALTLADFDQNAGTITINKTYHRFDKEDHITTPKTENSNRTVTLPPFLVETLKEYITHIYDIQPETRLFPTVTPRILKYAMHKGSSAAGLTPIRLHEIRHSHVSLLIDMGFSPYLIAERIGDTPEMVNRVYGHLYPNRHQEVADKLQALVSK